MALTGITCKKCKLLFPFDEAAGLNIKDFSPYEVANSFTSAESMRRRIPMPGDYPWCPHCNARNEWPPPIKQGIPVKTFWMAIPPEAL